MQEHKANHEIMSESVNQNEYTPVYAEPEHKTDRESLLDWKPDYAAPWRKVDREFTLEAVKKSKKRRPVFTGATTGGATTFLVSAKASGC